MFCSAEVWYRASGSLPVSGWLIDWHRHRRYLNLRSNSRNLRSNLRCRINKSHRRAQVLIAGQLLVRLRGDCLRLQFGSRRTLLTLRLTSHPPGSLPRGRRGPIPYGFNSVTNLNLGTKRHTALGPLTIGVNGLAVYNDAIVSGFNNRRLRYGIRISSRRNGYRIIYATNNRRNRLLLRHNH